MGRLFVIVAVLLALAGAAQATALETARPPVIATTAHGLGSQLFRADAVSLRPVGRPVNLEFTWGSALRSPDGTRLAIARSDLAELRFLRLPTLRPDGAVQLGRVANVQPLAWLSRDRLIASFDTVAGQLTPQIAGIDAKARKVVWRRSLEGSAILAEARARGHIVLVLGPSVASGSARLVIVGADGRTRSVGLDRLLVAGAGERVETVRRPGLAVDSTTNRAYVVDADALIAQVDLGAMTVAYRGGSRTFAKLLPGRERQAIWLGNGNLAVTGSDASMPEVNGVVQFATTPAGLYLVNAETGAVRLLQREAASAALVGRALVAYGVARAFGATKETGSGLTVYGLDGTVRAHFFGTTPISDVRMQRGLAYVSLPDRSGHIAVLDAAAARVLRTISRPTLHVLAG